LKFAAQFPFARLNFSIFITSQRKSTSVKSVFFILALTIASSTLAQIAIQNQVLASSGDHFENSQLAVDFTLGETFTATFENGSELCTQGFHQPEKASGASLSEFDLNAISLYPNPFQTTVTLSDPNGWCSQLEVYDVFGKRVASMAVSSVLTTVSLSKLANGNYHVFLTGENQTSVRYSLIKTANDYE
jgi:hypothetical protein